MRHRIQPALAIPVSLALLVCGAPAPAPNAISTGTGARAHVHTDSPTVSTLESRVHELVNAHRRSLGLSPLAYSAQLATIARGHSEDMATRRVPFGHDGFDARAEEVLKVLPYSDFAENVAYNDYEPSDAAQIAVSDWLDSKDHRERIEGAYDVTGVGIAVDPHGTYYFTQLFVKRE